MFLKRILLFFVCAGVSPLIILGQEVQVFNFDTEDGLPSPEVYFAFQDVYGYKWFGTDRGLAKYDGISFEIFNTSNSDLTDNTIFKCYEDPLKNLWFIAYNGTISIYMHSELRFEKFEFNDSLKKWFKYWPSSITFEDGGVRIMGTSDHYKYAFYDRNTGKIVKKMYLDDDYSQFKVNPYTNRKFYVSKENINNDPIILTNCSNCLEKDQIDGRWHVSKHVINKDTLFFAFESTVYFVHSNKIQVYAQLSFSVNHLSLNEQGSIGILTTMGYFINTSDGLKHLLKGYNLTGMAVDHEGLLWFSDLSKGVLRVPSIQFKLVTNDHLAKKIVTEIHPKNEVLFLGLNSREILTVDQQNNFKRLKLKTSGVSQPLRIHNINTTNGKTIATNSIELINDDVNYVAKKVYSKTKSAQTVYLGENKYISVPYSSGYSLHTASKGWNKISTDGERVTSIAVLDKNGLYLSTLGGLWFVSLDSLEKPRKLDLWGGKQVRINEVAVAANKCLVIATASDGLWFVTNAGLLKHLNKETGLSSNVVNCISVYGNTVYVGTNNGVNEVLISDSLDQKPGITRVINRNDGLISNYIYSVGVWRGRIWVGTDKGLSSFPRVQSHLYNQGPYLNIKSLFAREKSFSNHGSIFSSSHNDITIEFVGISSRKPVSKFYKHRLIVNGIKMPYEYTDNNLVNFYKLKPGNYVFELICTNKDGILSDRRLVSFVIQANIFQTVWFKILFFCFLAAVGVSYFYYRIYETRIYSTKKSELSDLKFKFKESELALLRNQMNPHFIFNALNSIQSYILQNDIETGSEYIKRFSDLMRSSLEYSRSERITLESELNYLEAYLKIEQFRFPNRFKFYIKLDSTVDLGSFIPPLLIQPIVENAIKHAFSGSIVNGKILLTFIQFEEEIVCRVYDNGIGIKKAMKKKKRKHNSIGMLVVKERLHHLDMSEKQEALIYTDRSLKTKNKTGTVVSLRIPLDN